MQELHDLSKPFKYVVSCVIVQKNGAGFHIGHSAYWDISNDNICQVSCCLDWNDPSFRKGRGREGSRDEGLCVVPTVVSATGWGCVNAGVWLILWSFFRFGFNAVFSVVSPIEGWGSSKLMSQQNNQTGVYTLLLKPLNTV